MSLVKDYIEKHGGIQGVVAEFEKTGFGQQVTSWISTGPNLPINAEQIQQALGSEKVKAMAAKFGIPVDKVADLLAKHLPPLRSIKRRRKGSYRPDPDRRPTLYFVH